MSIGSKTVSIENSDIDNFKIQSLKVLYHFSKKNPVRKTHRISVCKTHWNVIKPSLRIQIILSLNARKVMPQQVRSQDYTILAIGLL